MKKLLIFLCFVCAGICARAQDNTSYDLVPYRLGDKWGFADADKAIKIKPVYESVDWFHSDLAVVKIKGKYGYINTAGKMVIPAIYLKANPFQIGYNFTEKTKTYDEVPFAGVSPKNDGYEICINKKGVRIKCPAVTETEELALIDNLPQRPKYDLVADSGRQVFDRIIADFNNPGDDNTYYIAQKAGSYGLINNKREIKIPFEYTGMSVLNSEGYNTLLVERYEKKGVMNTLGIFQVPLDYEVMQTTMHPVNRNKLLLILRDKGDQFGLCDLTHQFLLDRKYEKIEPDSKGYIFTDFNQQSGYLNLVDDKTIAPKYKSMTGFRKSPYCQVTLTNGKWGYINAQGEEFWQEQ
jgi:WG containing repeat